MRLVCVFFEIESSDSFRIANLWFEVEENVIHLLKMFNYRLISDNQAKNRRKKRIILSYF